MTTSAGYAGQVATCIVVVCTILYSYIIAPRRHKDEGKREW